MLDSLAHLKEEKEAEQAGVQQIGGGICDSVNTVLWAGPLEGCTALSHVPGDAEDLQKAAEELRTLCF